MATPSKPEGKRDAGAIEVLVNPRKDSLGRNRPMPGSDIATWEGYLASGLTGAEYARLHGINYSTFCSRTHRARRLLEGRASSLRKKSPASATSAQKVNEESPFVRVELPAQPPATSSLSLVLPGNLRIEGADIPTLVTLIRALGGAA